MPFVIIGLVIGALALLGAPAKKGARGMGGARTSPRPPLFDSGESVFSGVHREQCVISRAAYGARGWMYRVEFPDDTWATVAEDRICRL